MLKSHFCMDNSLKKFTKAFLKARIKTKTIIFN
jgi:hypothetical protein